MKCKSETARSAKASLGYYKVIYIISEIFAGVKRILQKFAFLRGFAAKVGGFASRPPKLRSTFL